MFTTYTSQTDSNDSDYWDAYLAACIEQKRTLLANCLESDLSLDEACEQAMNEYESEYQSIDRLRRSSEEYDPLLDKDEYDERNDV